MQLNYISYLAAWMPSHVDDNLIKILSFEMPSASYALIRAKAFFTWVSLKLIITINPNYKIFKYLSFTLSNDNLIDLKIRI